MAAALAKSSKHGRIASDWSVHRRVRREPHLAERGLAVGDQHQLGGGLGVPEGVGDRNQPEPALCGRSRTVAAARLLG